LKDIGWLGELESRRSESRHPGAAELFQPILNETSLVATMIRHVERKAISLQIKKLAQKISCTAYTYSQLSVFTEWH
jgi:replicative DNA helicase